MRRLTTRSWIVLLIVSLSVSSACKRKPRPRAEGAAEEAPVLASMIHAADPRAANQLKSGFHQVEGNAWRWTARQFAVELRPPAGAAQKGATLVLKFGIPETVIDKLKTLTVAATIKGVKLSPEAFNKAGQFTYTRDVPSNALAGDVVLVEFTLDKAVPPNAQDSRELGVVASLVGFEAKP